MKSSALFYFCLLKTSIKASVSKRGAFLIESFLMIANNLIFFAIWWIFFRRFPDVAGWNFSDMILLMAVGTGSYGLMQVCFGGVRNLSKIILAGDLDPFLTKPKSILLHIAGSKSHSKGWGHLMTSVILTCLGGFAMPHTAGLIFVSICCGGVVFASINIVAHSLPFWMGPVQTLSKKYTDVLFLLSLYPTNIYSGFLQIVMFTLLPAGVITFLPVEMLKEFNLFKLLFLILCASLFAAFSVCVFYLGLRRYESGSTFGTGV